MKKRLSMTLGQNSVAVLFKFVGGNAEGPKSHKSFVFKPIDRELEALRHPKISLPCLLERKTYIKGE